MLLRMANPTGFFKQQFPGLCQLAEPLFLMEYF
jgi:hypothetical protein